MNKFNIIGTIFRGVAIFLLVTAFLLLLISGTTVIEEEAWGVKTSGYSRIDLDSEYSYSSDNFFGRMNYLDRIGFSTGLEVVTLVAFAVTLAYLVVAFFVPFLRKIYFSAIPLSIIGLLIAVLIDNDTWYAYNYEYLGIAYGYSIYTQMCVKFELVLIPSLIVAVLVFGAALVSGLMDLLGTKKAPMVEEVEADAVVPDGIPEKIVNEQSAE